MTANPTSRAIFRHPAWAVTAAFGTYFCMYGFRKPYTAGSYAGLNYLGTDYKILLVIAQTFGYVIAKWLGVKVISEIKAQRRITMLVFLILTGECMLLFFGWVPRPWNLICLFLNGCSLGMVFGLVLGFLEGKKSAEFMIAGLCASFIVSDGVSKSVGAFLLQHAVSENWMPFVAGLLFLVPSAVFITMLAFVPAPSDAETADRSKRSPMTAAIRRSFFLKYAPGLIGITAVYVFVTLLRSLRADFAPELWKGLGYQRSPSVFTQSEVLVSFGVVVCNGLATFISNHSRAFFFSLFLCLTGFVLIIFAVLAHQKGLAAFPFMVVLGLGVYFPYVAIHTIVFERLIAITKEKANIGFLMYIVDSAGYTAYIGLMLLRYFVPAGQSFLGIFLQICMCLGFMGIVMLVFCQIYFRKKIKQQQIERSISPAGQGSFV